MLPIVNNIKCEDAEYMVFSGSDGISVSLFTKSRKFLPTKPSLPRTSIFIFNLKAKSLNTLLTKIY